MSASAEIMGYNPLRAFHKGKGHFPFNQADFQDVHQALFHSGEKFASTVLKDFITFMKYSSYDRRAPAERFVNDFLHFENNPQTYPSPVTREIFFAIVILVIAKNDDLAFMTFSIARSNGIFKEDESSYYTKILPQEMIASFSHTYQPCTNNNVPNLTSVNQSFKKAFREALLAALC